VRDLETRADLDTVLRAFYAAAFDDELLGHVFRDVARMDLEEHLPRIGAFWEKVLFGSGVYSGDAMGVHRRLSAREPLTPAHFERWLALWAETVEARHEGPTASLATRQASRIAGALQRNLQRSPGLSGLPAGQARDESARPHTVTVRRTAPAAPP
jgi:hemoglobin